MLRQNHVVVNNRSIRTGGGPVLPSTPVPLQRKSTPARTKSAPGPSKRVSSTRLRSAPAKRTSDLGNVRIPPKIPARATDNPFGSSIVSPFPTPKETSFPTFEDGDVIITLSAHKVYQLHSTTLMTYSKVLNRLLLSQNKVKKSPGVARYRIRYVPNEEPPNSDQELKFGTFQSEEGAEHPAVDVQNGRVVDASISILDNIFRIMYDLEPDFDHVNFGEILHGCIGILDAAECLETSIAVHRTVDRVLTNEGQSLYLSIQDAPTAWSDLAMRIQSANILKEALVHLIGKWGSMDDEEKLLLRPEIQWICSRKYEELAALKYVIELRMIEFHPKGVLMASVKRQATAPGRNAYAGRIYWWMCLGIFRSWLGKQICEGKGSSGPDGGATMFRQISAGGEAYLGAEDSKAFDLKFPMSQKASMVMSSCMDQLKETLKLFVEPLMEDNTCLKRVDGKQLDYLTCAKIEPIDFPWHPKFGQTGQSILKDHMKRLDPLEQFEMDAEQLNRFYDNGQGPHYRLDNSGMDDDDDDDSFGLENRRSSENQSRDRTTDSGSRSRSRSPVARFNGNANGHRERSPVGRPRSGPNGSTSGRRERSPIRGPRNVSNGSASGYLERLHFAGSRNVSH